MVFGDFNVAPEDRDVHDPAAWVGCVHVSPEERAALARITELELVDAFRHFEQPEKSFSWWDYRQGAFRRNNGLRIDLILVHRQLLPPAGRLPHRRRAAARRTRLRSHAGDREFQASCHHDRSIEAKRRPLYSNRPRRSDCGMTPP